LANSLKRLLSKEVKAEALRRWFPGSVYGDCGVEGRSRSSVTMSLLEYAEGFPRRHSLRHAGFSTARAKPEIRHLLESRGSAARRQDQPLRRHERRPVRPSRSPSVTSTCSSFSHLVDDKIHARSIGPVLAHHAAAARRQSAVSAASASAKWKSGPLEAYGAAAHPAGAAHGEVGRRPMAARRFTRPSSRAKPGIEPGVARVVQRPRPRVAVALAWTSELMKRQKPAGGQSRRLAGTLSLVGGAACCAPTGNQGRVCSFR